MILQDLPFLIINKINLLLMILFNLYNQLRLHKLLEKEYINYSLNKLKAHGVIVTPTDTFYGISCDAFDSLAVDKIFKIKKRPKDQLLPVLISEKNELNRLGVKNNEIIDILTDNFWPGALTIILKSEAQFPNTIQDDLGFVGFRVPDISFTRNLIKELGNPITGTSANISGKKESKDISVIKNYFQKGEIDFYVDLECGKAKYSSTVIKIIDNKFSIIRQGAIMKKEIIKKVPKLIYSEDLL
ncbi:MAG: threonylcarbamoyl-AMP synthase [Chloroflexi bacterium]|nr:threonylcarbamoyl-AMP synthase [Chloroflexota bacterium]